MNTKLIVYDIESAKMALQPCDESKAPCMRAERAKQYKILDVIDDLLQLRLELRVEPEWIDRVEALVFAALGAQDVKRDSLACSYLDDAIDIIDKL